MPPPTSHMLHSVIICPIQVVRALSMSIDRILKTRLLYGALNSSWNQLGHGK